MRTVLAVWLVGSVGCSGGSLGVEGQDPTGPGLDRPEVPEAPCDDCAVHELGPDGQPWEPDATSGLEVDEDGALTLGIDPFNDDSVWVANTNEGTVSRLDAKTGREVGRYPSVLAGDNGARPWDEPCNGGQSTGNCPSRTAIDFRRDCWVANRAFGHQGTVSKIAARESDCIDRNGNGTIETSRDDDGDGRISPGEVVPDDECVLFTVDVGGPNGIPRALAIAPSFGIGSAGGHAWVGANTEAKAYELDGDDGHVIRSVDLPLHPYGALASKVGGLVWFVNAGWQADSFEDNPPAIVAVELASGQVRPRHEVESAIEGCVGTYGITLDLHGRVWTGGSPCEAVFRFDPADETWVTVDLDGRGNTRGLVADADGSVWVAHSRHDGEVVGNLTRIDADRAADPVFYSMPTGKVSVGVDLDAEGRIWMVNQQTNNAARLDPETGRIDEFPVGAKPYSYSDFTGHSLLLQFPMGVYTGRLQACGELAASFQSVHWHASVPEGTAVELRVRTAATEQELDGAPWFGPWTESPADLGAPPGPLPAGQLLEYELTLRTLDGVSAPTVRSLRIVYSCGLQ